jgi:hypothetical protein
MPATAEARTAVVCLCKHGKEKHQSKGCTEPDCECRRYWARPCKCGHRPEEHNTDGACRVCPKERDERKLDGRSLKCQGFEPDSSPAWLLRMGVPGGRWRTAVKAHDETVMQFGTTKERVYAYLASASTGRGKRRIAVKGHSDGRPVPVQPADILAGLEHEEKLLCRRLKMPYVRSLDRRHISRALQDLADEGRIRLAGMPVRGHRIIGVYSRPRRGKPPEPPPEPPPEEPGNVIKSDDISDDKSYVINNLIFPLRKLLVKRVSDTLRKQLAGMVPENVIESDDKSWAQELVDQALNVITDGYISRVNVIRSGPPINKEEEISIGSKSSSSERERSPEEPTTTTEDPVAQAVHRHDPLAPPRLIEELKTEVRKVDPEASDGEIAYAVAMKAPLAKRNPAKFFVKAVPECFQPPAPWKAELRSREQAARAKQEAQEAENREYARQVIADPSTPPDERKIWLDLYPELAARSGA